MLFHGVVSVAFAYCGFASHHAGSDVVDDCQERRVCNQLRSLSCAGVGMSKWYGQKYPCGKTPSAAEKQVLRSVRIYLSSAMGCRKQNSSELLLVPGAHAAGRNCILPGKAENYVTKSDHRKRFGAFDDLCLYVIHAIGLRSLPHLGYDCSISRKWRSSSSAVARSRSVPGIIPFTLPFLSMTKLSKVIFFEL